MPLNIVIFSGAGLSTESGIPTFRDAGGLWEKHRIEDVASPEGWRRDKKLVLEFYAMRFQKQQECRPNAAHESIARLSRLHTVTNITQNIDTLLERAGIETVWHLHGRIDMQKCEHHQSLAFEYSSDFECDYKSSIQRPIVFGDQCPKCGGQLRPDIVWFGEPVNMREEYLMKVVQSADVFIGVGTSAQVYPAAGILPLFRGTEEKYFIDPYPNYDMLPGYTVLEGAATDQMPKLAERYL